MYGPYSVKRDRVQESFIVAAALKMGNFRR